MTDPQVTLVVVTWNSADVVGGLLDSLRNHPPAARYEVVVVDNASADATLDLVRAHPV